MDSLMEINKLESLCENQERNNFMCLFNWLDTKLEITPAFQSNCIKRSDLQKYVITNYFNNIYYENIHFVKQILKIYFKFSTKNKGAFINISMLSIDMP